MNEKLEKFLRKCAMDAAMVVLFLIISLAYFSTPVAQKLVLGGHDSDAAVSQGHEQEDYRAAHDGETTRWSNAMFSGMPTYQIAPSYESTKLLGKMSHIFDLNGGGFDWLTGAFCYLFVFLLGFYIMMRAFNFRPYLAALGAIVWAFSSYFFIIIAAGHIWKVMTLAYIPPVIGGMVLCYRGRLLLGGAVTALFTAFQVMSNHVQMSYYFFFVMLFIALAYAVQTLRRKPIDAGEEEEEGPVVGMTAGRWVKATATVVVAGLLGIAANLPNLYHTYQYAEHSMRGGSELTAKAAPATDANADANAQKAEGEKAKGGLDYDYITQWSYGVGETMTLLIPDFNGGGTDQAINEENVYDEPQSTVYNYYVTAAQTAQSTPELAQKVKAAPGLNAYWGNQPFTVGPVYAGALVCFLFILGLFVVRGPMKWAMAAATVLSLLFAWGHNVPGVAHFLIDHLPMYNKFRTVSSALVIAEFAMPLLAVMALAVVLRRRDVFTTVRGKAGLITATVLTVGVCLAFWLIPSLAGNLLSADEAETMNAFRATLGDAFADDYTAAVNAMRGAVLSASAGRSLLVLVFGMAVLAPAVRVRRLPSWAAVAALGAVCLVDMWGVNKRYLNDDTFSDPVIRKEQLVAKSPADEQILADTDPDYRVLSYAVGSPFSENSVSYWHKNVGGYHAAKLQRYQDLIDRCLEPERQAFYGVMQQTGGDLSQVNLDSVIPVLNMLNTKYFIATTDIALRNPAANGNGWFVTSLDFVKGADAEMAALQRLDTKHAAVADETFRNALSAAALDSGSVRLTAYEPNELHYDVTTQRGGVAVFSEIYYPGWTATVDGKQVEVGRVNYVLRAISVPAGSHKVVFEFRPASVSTTNAVAYAAIIVILLGFVGAIALSLRKTFAAKADSGEK